MDNDLQICNLQHKLDQAEAREAILENALKKYKRSEAWKVLLRVKTMREKINEKG